MGARAGETRMRMKRSLMWAVCLIIVLLLSSGPFSLAGQSSPELRRDTFEFVWRRVKEKYYDPQFNGVNWDDVRERYAPRVAAVKTDDELYVLLNQMLGELRTSHFQIIPPSAYGEGNGLPANAHDEPGKTGGDGDVGIEIRLVEGRPTISRVEPQSPAALARLRPGFIVTHINDAPLSKLVKQAAPPDERPSLGQMRFRELVSAQLSGPVGSTVCVRYLNQRDHARSATLTRRQRPGEPVKFGELPVLSAELEVKRLQHNIGYVRFNVFLMPLLPRIQQAVQSFQDAPGMILDLRGNPGGVGAMAMSVARLFYTEPTTLGTMQTQQGQMTFTILPVQEQPAYRGPLAILVDEGSASTAEVLAGGMQENGRAIIVGHPSAGMVMPSVIEVLPIGARLQYAFADFKTPKGTLLEGRGVKPDVPVHLSRRELLAGDDPVVQKAITTLLKQQSEMKLASASNQ